MHSVPALVPMRAQPLHNGHLNLLLNLAERFGKVCIMLSQHVGGDDDPYSSEIRRSWLDKGIHTYSLQNTEIFERGSSRLPTIAEQKKSYQEIAGGEELVFVSGNPEIIERCIEWYQFHFLDLNKIVLDKKIEDMNDVLMQNIEGNARTIRHAIKQALAIEPGYLPTFVNPDELRLGN